MMKLLILTLVLLFGLPSSVTAQTIRLDRLEFNTGTCLWSSGTGSPEGVKTGSVCDYWIQTDTPYDLYRKTSGTGNTGWVKETNGLSAGLTGSGVANRGAYWSGTSALTSSANFNFNGTALGVGAGSEAGAFLLNVWGTTTQLGLAYNGGNYMTATVGSTGTTTFDVNGTSPTFIYNDNVTMASGVHVLPIVTHTSDVGALTKKVRTLYASELTVETLVAQDVIATIGGQVIVAPTTLLTADLASGGTTITVKHNTLSNGDRIVLKDTGNVEWMAIASVAGGTPGLYTYTVTRNLDASGANDWIIGDAVVNTGTTGDGYIDLYALTGLVPGTTAGPTIAFNARTGTTWSDIATRGAVGNLNGLYGYVAETYGVAFGNPATSNIVIDAVDGFRARSSTTDRIKLAIDGSGFLANTLIAWDTGGNLTVTGNATIAGWEIGTTYIRAAADDVGISSAVTGGDDIRFWAGDSTMASAEFRVTEAGALTATSATITGTVTATAGTIGGCTIASASITCGTVNDVAVMSSGDATYRFWAGDATAASAEFSVTKVGVVKMTEATVSGSVNVGTGGNVRSGATAFDTGTGYWMDYNAGTPRFRFGETGSGDLISWDGTTLVVRSGPITIDNNGLVVTDVELSSTGLTLNNGVESGTNRINWDASGHWIQGAGGSIKFDFGATCELRMRNTESFGGECDDIELGTTGNPWNELYVLVVSTTTASYPIVTLDAASSGQFAHKTDGYNGTNNCGALEYVSSITAEYGIYISHVCTALPIPDPRVDTLVEEVTSLKKEMAELRELIAVLLGRKEERQNERPIR